MIYKYDDGDEEHKVLIENEKADRKTIEALMDGTYVKPQAETETVPVADTTEPETTEDIIEE